LWRQSCYSAFFKYQDHLRNNANSVGWSIVKLDTLFVNAAGVRIYCKWPYLPYMHERTYVCFLDYLIARGDQGPTGFSNRQIGYVRQTGPMSSGVTRNSGPLRGEPPFLLRVSGPLLHSAPSNIRCGGPPGRRTNRPTWQVPGGQVCPACDRPVMFYL